VRITEAERDKYSKVWGLDDYAVYSPGKETVDYFFRIARPGPGQSVLDVGAGSGAGSKALKDKGLSVRAFDITDVAWRHPDIHLDVGCVWRDLNLVDFDFVYCCDMMEHIPTEFVGLTLDRILKTCESGKAFFSISFTEDHFGTFIGQDLHLTVKPFAWWRDMLRELGKVHEARDRMGHGVFLVGR